jgi:hypothetical protein
MAKTIKYYFLPRNNRMRDILFIILAAVSFAAAQAGGDPPGEKEFWGWESGTANTLPPFPKPQPKVEGSHSQLLPLAVINFYKSHITDLISTHCPSYPSCSSYGKQCIERHGFLGILMTIDRLYYRENNAMQYYYKLVDSPKGFKFFDPPENNYIFDKSKWKIQ